MAERYQRPGPGDGDETLRMLAVTQPRRVVAVTPPARRAYSFEPTGWRLADRALERVDALSGGRADVIQRLASYLIISGAAALLNLAAYGGLVIFAHASFLIAQLVAAEISIMASFIPNDRVTFSRLPGHARSWWARCVRFHLTSAGGTFITIGASFALLQGGAPKLVAQACAILIAMVFSFTVHNLFTYGRTRAPRP